MQKHPMYSVKEAAIALGCDERWVREQLNQGQLKGEKQSTGLKEKWYVYKGEIERALARKGAPSAPAQGTSTQQFFGVEAEEAIDAEVASSSAQVTDNHSVADLVKIIAGEFAQKLDAQMSLTFQLQRELEDKDRQLKLLPNPKHAEEALQKEIELQELKKQLQAVQELKEKAEADAEKAQELEENVLPELRKQVEIEKALKEQILADLTRQLKSLEDKHQDAERAMNEERVRKGVELERLKEQASQAEEHRKAVDIAQSKIEELERLAQEHQRSEEEKENALEELRRLQEEKDAQLVAMQEQVAELSKKPKSWLRRFFLGNYA